MVKNTQVKRLEKMCGVRREFKVVHPILLCYLPHFIANMRLMAIKQDYWACRGKRRKRRKKELWLLANPGKSQLSSIHFLLPDSVFQEDHQRCGVERLMPLYKPHYGGWIWPEADTHVWTVICSRPEPWMRACGILCPLFVRIISGVQLREKPDCQHCQSSQLSPED